MNDTLFYDGRCGLCAHEITLLRRFSDDALTLQDIHATNTSEVSAGIEPVELLSILHLRTHDGNWLKGLDATVRAWRHTHFGWILIPLRWPPIAYLADWAYLRWANQRACKLGYKAPDQSVSPK